MTENNKNVSDKNDLVAFVKVEQLRKGSLGLHLLLRPDDIIVGVNKEIFRGGQKALNQQQQIIPLLQMT